MNLYGWIAVDSWVLIPTVVVWTRKSQLVISVQWLLFRLEVEF